MTFARTRSPTHSLSLEDHIGRFQGIPPARRADPMRTIRQRSVDVLIGNLATLVEELAEVIAANGEAVHLGALITRLKGTEVSLRLTVEDTAKAAGLVAS